jgi:outer membrane protein, heavy metal efflux system
MERRRLIISALERNRIPMCSLPIRLLVVNAAVLSMSLAAFGQSSPLYPGTLNPPAASPVTDAAAMAIPAPSPSLRMAPLPQAAPVGPVDSSIPSAPGTNSNTQVLTGSIYSFDELERTALANNPTLAILQRQVEAAQGSQYQAGLYPNPVIGYVAEDMGESGSAGLQGISLSQEIVTGGKLSRARTTAARQVEQAVRRLETHRLRVINDVRAAAYDAAAAQRTVLLQSEVLISAEETTEMFRTSMEAQEASRLEYLETRIATGQARMALDTAQGDAEAAWRRLSVLIGAPNISQAPIENRLEIAPPEYRWEEVLSQLLAASPEVTEARAAVSSAEAVLAQERAASSQNFEVGASLLYDTGGDQTVASLDFGVPLRLYDRNEGNIRRAASELAAAREEIRRVELDLQNRLAQQFAAYQNALCEVRRYDEEIVPDAEETLKLIEDGFIYGELTNTRLLLAQRAFWESKLGYVQSLRRLHAACVQMDGMLLSGALDAPTE